MLPDLARPGLEMYNGRISHEVKRSVRARERGKITPCHFDTQRYILDTKSILGWFAFRIPNRGRVGVKRICCKFHALPLKDGAWRLSLLPSLFLHPLPEQTRVSLCGHLFMTHCYVNSISTRKRERRERWRGWRCKFWVGFLIDAYCSCSTVLPNLA